MKPLITALVVFISIISLFSPLAAQEASDGEKRWEALMAAAVEAYHAGHYDEAAHLTEDAYRLSLNIFGETHPSTLTSLSNLALLYGEQGRFSEAEPLHQQSLELRRETLGETHSSTLNSLNNLALLYVSQGRYGEAEPLYEQALQLRSETLGEAHPDTLRILHNLMVLYLNQGRYGEAEPHLQQVLQRRRETLGEAHPDTLSSLTTLAGLYQSQGRYHEAEPLIEQALQRNRETLGETHPHTLVSLNNLATLYRDQGRYGEAESLFEQALQLRRETLGKTHPESLSSLNGLAALYRDQGRYGEAESLFEQALQLHRETLGKTHPGTLSTLNNLANVYQNQGRYIEAEPLYKQALQLCRETLGETHPQTLVSLNNLASLYRDQGRYGESKPLYEQALKLNSTTLGETHPWTLNSLNNLANLYGDQGRYVEAEPLLQQALELASEFLGPAHPLTLLCQSNYTGLLVLLDKTQEAIIQLRQMEPQRLAWTGAELYSTEGANVRSELLLQQSFFQDTVLTLAVSRDDPDALSLAGDVILRWKQIQGTEQAYLAKLVRGADRPAIKKIGQEMAWLRARLARLAQEIEPAEDPGALLQDLEAKELELARKSYAYKRHLEVSRAGLGDVQASLPPASALIEFRYYRPYDFAAREFGVPRFVAMLVRGQGQVVLRDVGLVEESGRLLAEMRHGRVANKATQAAMALHAQLFGAFAEFLDGIDTLYIAPDGLLNLVPFERLQLADGRYWAETQKLRFLQTGRDLLPSTLDTMSGQGLLALGGIDFDGEVDIAENQAPPMTQPVVGGDDPTDALLSVQEAVLAQLGRFEHLPGTGKEVSLVESAFKKYLPEEPIQVWRGLEATEGRLKSLDGGKLPPPRVLHLATHGFYLADVEGRLSRPQLYSGLSLAGANKGIQGDLPTSEDGVLYGLEAQGLNLEGTELVVLSACDTGKGTIDYSEGVVGMVQALRIAGARQILMTLWPVLDKPTAAFMASFYQNWLSHPGNDPATALDETKEMFRQHENPSYRRPLVWAPFVLIGM